MNFFFDRNVGIRLVRMLDAYDAMHTVRHQDDDSRFTPKTSDVDLLAALSSERPRPVFVTADVSMRKRVPHERRALAGSGLTVVFIRNRFVKNLDFHTQAVKLLQLWPELVRETIRAREPTAFEITPAAKKIQRLCTTRQLLSR